MRTVTGTIVILSFAFSAAAQVAQECPAPPEYPHTRLRKKITPSQKFSSGEKLHYGCAEDFTPSRGSGSVECRDGKWSRLTLKCEKKEITCSSPVVNNSVKSGREVSVHHVGDTMNITCSSGFQLDGAQQLTCGSDGQWQPKLPQCILSPNKRPAGGCDAPLIVSSSNANLADKYITMTSFSSGDKIYYKCDVGYTPVGGSRIRTCDNGKWTPLKLKCERKLCGHAGEISNGQFVYTGVEFGDTATAVCDEGFILVGKATRHCVSNGWDGRPAVCEAVECEEPTVTNAQRRNFQELPYTFRNVIQYECKVGSLVGSREIWCTSNGTWSSPPPQCKDIRCRSPNIPNAFWINAHKKTYRPMETISSFKCKPGYIFTGQTHLTCGSEGQWLQSLPKCVPRMRRG